MHARAGWSRDFEKKNSRSVSAFSHSFIYIKWLALLIISEADS